MTTEENEVVLTGLDGSNPLAFLAALGTLRVLEDLWRAEGRQGVRPRLRWQEAGGVWRPAVSAGYGAEDVLHILDADRARWQASAVLGLAHDKSGIRCDPGAPGAIGDVKLLPSEMAAFLDDLAADCTGNRRDLELVAGLVTDVAVDGNGRIKPTGLHFTAGQQRFLNMVVQLRDGTCLEDFRVALFGEWKEHPTLPSLSWDSTTERAYAYRASDPSKEKRGTIAGANWLAALGLALLPVFSVKGQARTRCMRGRWKSAVLRWPIWSPRAVVPELGSLLGTSELADLGVLERRARGVEVVFESPSARSETGGLGSFSAASVL